MTRKWMFALAVGLATALFASQGNAQTLIHGATMVIGTASATPL